MSKATSALTVDAPQRDAYDACRRAAASIDWELLETDADRIVAGQDPARLCCRSAPVTVEVALAATADRTTEITLRGRVPGIGPIASRDLRSALGLLEDTIRRSLA